MLTDIITGCTANNLYHRLGRFYMDCVERVEQSSRAVVVVAVAVEADACDAVVVAACDAGQAAGEQNLDQCYMLESHQHSELQTACA